MMRMTLRFKLFTAFFTLIILPLFLLGFAAYYFLSDTIEQKYSRQAELTLRALSQSVDFIFGEMNKVTDSTIASVAVQEVLNQRSYQVGKDPTEIDYLTLNETQKNFRDLLVNHPSVSYAVLYPLDGERIIKLYTKENFRVMPFAVFTKQPLYQDVLERNGLPKWVGPYEFTQLTGSDPVFTQIRVVKDIDTLDNKGILLVQIKNSGLQGLFRYFSFNQAIYKTKFYIVNEKGLIMFDSSDALHGRYFQEITNEYLDFNNNYQSKRQSFSGEDSIVSSIRFGKENWHLVSVTSWNSLAREIKVYSLWVAAIISLCLLSAFIFIMVFVNRIAKSIIRIVRFMGLVEGGELNFRVQESGKDELHLIARGLNSLLNRVSELISEVKSEQEHKNKAELRVLQAQIKPHFLFNTLESINALAVQNEGRKVSQMVYRLGNILRISIQDKEEISIRQEVEHLRSYLEIQKFRFEELFEFEIDVPDELMGYTILKLTLQPLVENSIQHGFEGIDYEGHLRIAVRSEGNNIVVYIEDNGIGIPNNLLNRFEYMASDELYGGKNAPGERRGLGVRSVADRIRIQYGSNYGLYICSTPATGTIIKCIIPKYMLSD